MTVEHHTCPEDVALRLAAAGGYNRLGDPNFKVVWGYDRIVPVYGEWQDWKTIQLPGGRSMMYPTSVIETRQVPKYLPGNRWHLERWCPPEMYGSPEAWGKLGQEVIGYMTLDTAGPYPSRGEYELVLTLSTTGGPDGEFIQLEPAIVEEIVRLVVASQDFTYAQRVQAIRQRIEREDKEFVRLTENRLRDGMRPWCGEDFIVGGTKDG